MKIYELIMQLSAPYVIDNDNDYYDSVKEKLTLFISLLKALKASDEIIDNSNKFKENLTKIIRQYYKGNIASAQIQMTNNIKNICAYDKKAKVLVQNSEVFNDTNMNIPFFRARLDADEEGFKSDEMGVVPFDKRSKISTARFSMPGVPCLYLGNTSYVCWLELGKPADHRFNVAPIYLDRTQIIFDLAVRFNGVYNIVDRDYYNDNSFILKENIDIGYIKRIMLFICSSFRVKEQNRVFKSEYIIPQLIMISCQKIGMDGVLYFSCKTSKIEISAVNLALYSKYPNNKFSINIRQSDLNNHMKIGDAYNYSLFKQLIDRHNTHISRLWIDRARMINSVDLQSKRISYNEMIFYKFDKYLLELWEENHPEDFVFINNNYCTF